MQHTRTVSACHLRHTVVRHHCHRTRIRIWRQALALSAIGHRLSRSRTNAHAAGILLLWVVHHVLRLLLVGVARLHGDGDLDVVGGMGLGLGLGRGAIGVEWRRRVPRAITISRRIHVSEW